MLADSACRVAQSGSGCGHCSLFGDCDECAQLGQCPLHISKLHDPLEKLNGILKIYRLSLLLAGFTIGVWPTGSTGEEVSVDLNAAPSGTVQR